MKSYINKAKNIFYNLETRERRLIVIAVLSVFIFIFYFFLYEPLVYGKKKLYSKLIEKKELAYWMDDAYARLANLENIASINRKNEKSLALSIYSTLEQNNIKASFTKQSGRDNINVGFENVVFNDLLSWLDTVQNMYNISVNYAEINKGSDKGSVNAEFQLELKQ